MTGCGLNAKVKSLLFAALTLSVFLLLLYLNIKTPVTGDDYTYSLIFDTNRSVQSFGDIVTSQITHYNIWGGRVIVHAVAQLLLLADPFLADVINSLTFVLFVLLICLHVNGYRGVNLSLFLGALLLVWFMEPFAETVMWLTGSANYMWGTAIILAFLLPYRLYAGTKKQTLPVLCLQAALMFGFGIVAGWTNENTAAGMLLMTCLYIFASRRGQKRIPLWMYAGLAGALTGFVFMIAAPGNAVRSQGVDTSAFIFLFRLCRHTQALLNTLGLLNIAVAALAVYLYKSGAAGSKATLEKSAVYILGVLASTYAMLLSPSFPERAWFGIIAFNIIALGLLVENMREAAFKYLKYGFITLGLCLFLVNFYDVYEDVNHVEQKLSEREHTILSGIEAGKDTIIIQPYHTKTKYAIRDASYSSPLLSRYYGVEVEFGK
jgi:hypothetical protein